MKNKPWITTVILISIKNKNNLLHNMTKSQIQQYKNEYQTYRNELIHVKEYAIKMYYNKEIEQSQQNSGLL